MAVPEATDDPELRRGAGRPPPLRPRDDRSHDHRSHDHRSRDHRSRNHRSRNHRSHDDRGAVTVEAALALLSVMLVLASAMTAFAAVTAALRCGDAAHELARLASRGDAERGRALAARLAPAGAEIVFTVRDGEVLAEVSAPPVPLLPVRVDGRAVAVLEPGVAP